MLDQFVYDFDQLFLHEDGSGHAGPFLGEIMDGQQRLASVTIGRGPEHWRKVDDLMVHNAQRIETEPMQADGFARTLVLTLGERLVRTIDLAEPIPVRKHRTRLWFEPGMLVISQTVEAG